MGFYASVAPGGLASVLERLDVAHRAFFEQHFLTASWYDALPMLPLSAAAAAALGKPHYEAMRDRASVQVESDASGVYRVILGMASVEMLVPRLPRAMMQYFDFGEASATLTSKTTCEVTHAGVPMPIVPLGVPLADGFLSTALRLAGATEISFDADPPERDGVAFGTPTYKLRFQVGWKLGVGRVVDARLPELDHHPIGAPHVGEAPVGLGVEHLQDLDVLRAQRREHRVEIVHAQIDHEVFRARAEVGRVVIEQPEHGVSLLRRVFPLAPREHAPPRLGLEPQAIGEPRSRLGRVRLEEHSADARHLCHDASVVVTGS
jgi:hypothetical protein